MNTGKSARPPTAILLSISLCALALAGSLLPIWDPKLVFSVFGRPNAHSGHIGAWTGAASLFLYVLTSIAAVAGAVLAASVASVRDRKWIWVLAGEVVVLGVGIWASVESVLSGNH